MSSCRIYLRVFEEVGKMYRINMKLVEACLERAWPQFTAKHRGVARWPRGVGHHVRWRLLLQVRQAKAGQQERASGQKKAQR